MPDIFKQLLNHLQEHYERSDYLNKKLDELAQYHDDRKLAKLLGDIEQINKSID